MLYIHGRKQRPFHPLSLFGFNKMNVFKNNRGATAVEFGLVALPVLLFLFGIIQTGYIVWIDNLLHISVDTAARCAAVNSTTSPCQGTDAVTPAQTVFGWSSGATFSSSNCTADGGTGTMGTSHITILFVVNLTLTAKSCYPTIPS
jgi:Flp pilus assembly protein TadG